MLVHDKNNKKNIIFLITDQQRYDAVGYVNKAISTPNINSLSKQSIICASSYVQSPQCQPSRASILTGRYPTAHKVWWNQTPLPKSEKTIANYLRKAGYATGYFGKIHLTDAENDGWDILLSHFGFQDHFIFWEWAENAKLTSKGQKALNEFHDIMNGPQWTGIFQDRQYHHEDVITKKAIDFIKNAKRPYFAMVGYHGPHPPYASPPPYNSMYNAADMIPPDKLLPILDDYNITADNWKELKSQYYGSVSWIDDNIGKILAVADDNTIIVFTADHGDVLGDHGLFSKGLYAYEGNTRVPLLFKIPNYEPYTYEHLIQSIDIMPTLLGIVGAEYDFVQGSDLTKHFKNNTSANDYIISMIGYGQDKLRMIRVGHWKYWVKGQEEFLYDLNKDPNENCNLFNNPAYSNVLSDIRYKMITALIDSEDPKPRPTQM